MKIATKKIVAIEFLFLITVLVLGLIAFISTYPYNSYRINQAEKLSITITEKQKLIDSIESGVKPLDNIGWLVDVLAKQKEEKLKFKPIGNIPAIPEGYTVVTPPPLVQLVQLVKDNLSLLQAKLNEQTSLVLNFDDQIVFGINSLIIFVILLFGFRYLFYALRWSIRTLKS